MSEIIERQFIVDDNGANVDFWWTPKGQAIRWAIFGGVVLLLVALLALGLFHAKRRIRKGLPPLAYHRWLLSRRDRELYSPSYTRPHATYYPYNPEQYGMYPIPPPVYDPTSPPPPTYQPPSNSRKENQSDWAGQAPQTTPPTGASSSDYYAPAGPPPPANRQ